MSEDQASVARRFERADEQLRQWEDSLRREDPSVDVAQAAGVATEIVKDLIKAYLLVLERDWEGSEELLDLWKVAVKKNPSLNTIRDNCRELVYYANCVEMDRQDALPANAHKQAIRTARHVYLYLRSRAEEAGALEREQGVGAN